MWRRIAIHDVCWIDRLMILYAVLQILLKAERVLELLLRAKVSKGVYRIGIQEILTELIAWCMELKVRRFIQVHTICVECSVVQASTLEVIA